MSKHDRHRPIKRRHSPNHNDARGLRRLGALLLGLFFLVGGVRVALAADVVSDEVFRLEAGATASDDLYIFAREVFIDGTVEGDLIAFAGYVEINGVVTGDVMSAAGSIVINGTVGDDARLAGSGIVITGNVADDLFAAGGGDRFSPFIGAFSVGRSVVPGIRLLGDAVVTADAYLAGGTGLVEGAVGRDLVAAFDSFQLSGRVDRDARLYARSLVVSQDASVGGTLYYSTAQPTALPQDIAADVVLEAWDVDVADPEPTLMEDGLWWLLRTIMVVLGLVVVGWLWHRFWPSGLARVADAITRQPVESAVWGAILLVLAVPLSVGFVFLSIIFWNWFPGGIAMFALTFGLYSWIWLLSPLPVGFALALWLRGRGAVEWNAHYVALAMAALIVIVTRMVALAPFAGGLAAALISVITVAFAVGGAVLALSGQGVAPAEPQPPAPSASGTAVDHADDVPAHAPDVPRVDG